MLLNWNLSASEISRNDFTCYSIHIAIQNPHIAIYRDTVLLGDTHPYLLVFLLYLLHKSMSIVFDRTQNKGRCAVKM